MGEQPKSSLRKSERLHNARLIENIFKSETFIKSYPLLFIYNFLETTDKPGLQVLFSVPKRKFPRSVDRNRIKRLMRESYRLQKTGFQGFFTEKAVTGAFIYIHKEMPDYQAIEKSVKKIIRSLHETTRH